MHHSVLHHCLSTLCLYRHIVDPFVASMLSHQLSHSASTCIPTRDDPLPLLLSTTYHLTLYLSRHHTLYHLAIQYRTHTHTHIHTHIHTHMHTQRVQPHMPLLVPPSLSALTVYAVLFCMQKRSYTAYRVNHTIYSLGASLLVIRQHLIKSSFCFIFHTCESKMGEIHLSPRLYANCTVLSVVVQHH